MKEVEADATLLPLRAARGCPGSRVGLFLSVLGRFTRCIYRYGNARPTCMDLLGDYGSDSEDSQESNAFEHTDKETDETRASVCEANLKSSGLPAGFFDLHAGSSSKPSTPKRMREPTEQALDRTGTAAQNQAGGPRLLNALPAPKARRVRLKLPAKAKLLLANSDSEEDRVPAAKVAKVTGAAAIVSCLPPPKQAGLGGAKASARGGIHIAKHMDQGPLGLQSFEPSVPDPAVASNELYRVDVQNRSAAPDNLLYGSSQPPDDALYGPARPPPNYSFRHQAAAAHCPEVQGLLHAGPHSYSVAGSDAHSDALLAEALQREKEKAAKANKLRTALNTDIKFVEVNQSDLTYMDPAAKEAADSVRTALGSEYALDLRTKAAAFTGSKVARRKHQIGTLYASMTVKELEVLETRAQSMKTKRETQAKYGW